MQLSSEFLHTILNALPDAVKIVQVDTRHITLVNASAKALYTDNGLTTLRLSDKQFVAEAAFIAQQMTDLLAKRQPKTYVFSKKVATGEKRFFELWACLGTADSFIVSITRDITEQRLLEREVLQREKMASIGQVTSSFAHEIKNPLTGIRLGLGLLEDNQPDKDVIKSISNDVERLDKILENLLGYAKVQDRNKTKIDVNILVERSLFLLRKEAENQDIEMLTEYSEIVPQVRADENEIQQVIVNLVLNAIQAISGRGRITVRTSNYSINEIFGALIEVVDDGCGIAEENLHKINTLFFTTKEKGTGLGLPMSQKIIREHGGSIVFESKEGIGTVVKVFIPIDI
jgi:signal transduction histidine kinase